MTTHLPSTECNFSSNGEYDTSLSSSSGILASHIYPDDDYSAFRNALKYILVVDNLNSFVQTQSPCLSSLLRVSQKSKGGRFLGHHPEFMDFLWAEGYITGFPNQKGNTRSQVKHFFKEEPSGWLLFAAFCLREGTMEAEFSLSSLSSAHQGFLNPSIHPSILRDFNKSFCRVSIVCSPLD